MPASLQLDTNDILIRQSTQLEMFSTDLAINLGSAFDKVFDERLSEHIAPLADAMRKLADGIGSRNESAMEQMLDSFLQRLEGGSGARMQEAAEGLGRVISELGDVQHGLAESVARITDSAGSISARMSESAEAVFAEVANHTQRLTGTLVSAADNLSSKIAELSGAAQNAISSLVASSVDLKSAGQAVRGAAEPLIQVANSLDQSVDRLTETSTRLKSLQDAAGELIQGLNAATQRFEGIDKELANTLAELQSGLQGFTRQVGTFVNQTDQNLEVVPVV
jgi:ABC-type transporter Mla subunit MlaD